MNLRLGTRGVVTIAVIVSVLIGGVYIFLSSPASANVASTPSRFTVNGKTFDIMYVATNETEWEAGLMNKKITNTTTMLFIFPRLAVYPFWMYHVNSSLDIIWLNVTGNEGNVVYIAADVPGCSLPIGCPNYTPTSNANYVIEAAGGFSVANGIGTGTTIRFS